MKTFSEFENMAVGQIELRIIGCVLVDQNTISARYVRSLRQHFSDHIRQLVWDEIVSMSYHSFEEDAERIDAVAVAKRYAANENAEESAISDVARCLRESLMVAVLDYGWASRAADYLHRRYDAQFN